MFRKIGFLLILVLVAAFIVSGTVQAAVTKYSFNDVVIDEQVVEIEAGVKSVNKGDFSSCSYYTDDYAEYLGHYTAPVSAGDTADEVLGFCVDNFGNRDS